jgi:uncharacterized protein with FMN-binding domain
MKKMLVMLIAVFAIVTVNAQNADQAQKKEMKKDCITMKDGKVWQTKDGQTTELQQDVALENGTVVSKDGNVKTKDGKTMMLKDGDCLWMNGKMTHMAMKKKEGKATGG